MTIKLCDRTFKLLSCAILSMFFCITLFHFLRSEIVFIIVDGLWMSFFTVTVLADISSLSASSSTRIIVGITFALRIILVLIAIYGSGSFSDFLSQGDQLAFWDMALRYYDGDFSANWTRYPYIIYFVFQIFGPSRLMTQMINVLFWYIGFKIIYISANRELYGKTKQLLVCFYSVLPMQILITVGIFRESILIFFIMVSIMLLSKWQRTGRNEYIIISTILALPSIILHGGCFAVWCTIFIVYVMWNPYMMRWRKASKKVLLLIIGIVLFVPVYEHGIARLSPYLPSTLSIETVTTRLYDPSRADYIIGSGAASNVPQFILQTIYRCIYFWISPTPRFWTSPLDIFGFAVDTVPWIIFLYVFFNQVRMKKNYVSGWTGIILFCTFTLIYAWGTRNAGTAMRHRDVLVGPMIMLMMYGLEDAKNKMNTLKRED